jgi:hypothetical protein
VKEATMQRVMLAAAVVFVALAAAAGVGRAQQLDPRIAEWDAGPAKIDVSRYPSAMKDRYKLFADQCSRCHTLARAINIDFVLDEEWERYIKKMMRRGKGVIAPAEAAEIYEFLIFDSKIRKKDLYEKKLAAR